MDDQDQTNKKHIVPKAGRKAREDNKVKNDNKEIHHDSRGYELVKTKRKIDKINKKAFAIQNVAKAKKKVATIVDRQTARHTMHTFSTTTINCPHLIAIMGPTGCGKSTLMRTMMRHYTGQRKNIEGPVTVVCSKKRRVTLLECKNDLAAMIDVAKVADTILMLINIEQGLQTETFELIEALHAHGATRVMIVYTHIDKYPKFDKKAIKKMKLITKRLQTEINAKTFNLTEIKKMRDEKHSEYKIEDVVNLARLIGQKNALPNEWRDNHPYIVVDRIERNMLKSNDEVDSLKFYGYVRGCKMSADIKKMHLMGVADLTVNSVTVLNDPCPTPQQESETKVKRQPLALKERKAYAPMCGYGGVLKDADGFHIVSQKDADNSDESDEEVVTAPIQSSLIQEMSDSSDENDESSNEEDENDDEDGPPAKKRLIDSGADDLIKQFDVLESEMNINNSAINYERLVYDEDYVCQKDPSLQPLEVHNDLFVSGTWGENEDAATLLKKDDANRQIRVNKDEGDSDEEEECEIEDEEDGDMSGDDEDEDNSEMDDCDMEDEVEEECDIDEDEGYEMDESDDNSEEEGESDDNSEADDDNTNEWVADTENMTEFQKKKLERASKTKRQKRLEKKEKQKALFDKMYDEKSGGDSASAFFDKWKADHNEQEQQNQAAFNHIDKDNVYKFAGIAPGAYVAIEMGNIPKQFFNRFKPSRAVILGGLAPGEETSAILTVKFSLHRHFNQAEVIKQYDPLCISIGWRRIQPFCHFFKEEDNLRKSYLKYSAKKGLFCYMAFRAPVVPVKTGFMALLNFKPNPQFRIVGLGSVHSKDDNIDIMKKLRRIGEPFLIFKKSAIITNMFQNDLEVEANFDALLKTTAGVRGAVKKSVNEKNYPAGSFRATFEAPISMNDRVNMTCFVKAPLQLYCKLVTDLLEEDFEYFLPWNQYKKENGIDLPKPKPDSEYTKVVRPVFNPGPIKTSQKVIDKLPFANRPPEPKPQDLVQQCRPKVVLDATESKRAWVYSNLLATEVEKRQKQSKEKQKFKVKKQKTLKEEKLKHDKKEKEKRQKFFKKNSIKSGKVNKKKKQDD